MIKKITPLILSLVFTFQTCIMVVSASPTASFKSHIKVEQAKEEAGTDFGIAAIENEELDEDEIQHLPIIAVLTPIYSGTLDSHRPANRPEWMHQPAPRTHSSVQSFTCVFTI